MLKKVLSTLAVVAISTFVLTGCSRAVSVYNVDQTKVEIKKGKSSEDVYQAIKKAGAGLGWIVTKKKEGTAEGRLMLRKHLAVVEIPYSTKSYSINYKNSNELNYNPSNNTIHKNYNSWIQNLDNAIQIQLNALN